jgi:ferredoxin--NADP+ reductase
MSELGSESRPLRVAVVGSGPSGFYAAEALFKSDANVQVDLYDRLPTPFGLVRGGVAPDHAKIKNVIKVYDRIAQNPGFTFHGNVTIGETVSVEMLRRFHDAVILTTGAETDRRLGIPGEDLPGSHTATAFVGWYNGHPDYRDHRFNLSGEVAVVIGQGNVAMDVTRILAKTVDELRHTDIAEYALDALAESRIKEVHLIGRRGPVQAKCTPPELKEIGELADCDPIVHAGDLEFDPASQTELDDPASKNAQKNVALLREFMERGAPAKNRHYYFHFFKSPVEIVGDDHVHGLKLEHNELTGEPFKLRASGTGSFEEMPCDILFRSVGYRGVPIAGVPFHDKWGVIPNEAGRVTEDGEVVSGLYTAGWIKRGPSGVIGTNKPCSVETVEKLLEDLSTLTPCPEPDADALQTALTDAGCRSVSYAEWQQIDQAEIERGKAQDKPREKFATIPEMLDVLR